MRPWNVHPEAFEQRSCERERAHYTTTIQGRKKDESELFTYTCDVGLADAAREVGEIGESLRKKRAWRGALALWRSGPGKKES